MLSCHIVVETQGLASLWKVPYGPKRKTYNKTAAEWTEKHYGGWGQESIDRFISLLPRGASVLDLGCGSGIRSKDLADAGLNVLGIDFAERMIEIAKKKVPKADFRVLDVCDMASLTKKFDGIFAMAILLHFPKKEVRSILKQIKGSLKNDGYLYLAMKERKGREKDEKNIKSKINNSNTEVERFFSLFKMDEIRKELNELKMKIVYEETLKMRARNWLIVIAQK